MKRMATSGGLLLLLTAIGLLLFGSLRLFSLRFEMGDTYPEWSSLRSDPRGTRALHDALALLSGVRVARLDRPLRETAPPAGTALLRIGEVGAESAELRSFVLQGGRLVVALPGMSVAEARSARRRMDFRRSVGLTNDWRRAASPAGSEARRAAATNALPASQWGDLWAVTVHAATNDLDGTAQPVAPGLDAMPWRSAFYFAPQASNIWQTLMTADGRPVIIERAYGRGSLVLAADGYFLSNEAMLRDRHPALLARLVNGARRVVFDETIHGIREQRGMNWLLRRYHLGGVGVALLALTVLYLWQCAVPLLPRVRATNGDEDVAHPDGDRGFESRDGYVALLRRAVPDADLLRVCVETWERSGKADDAAAGTAARAAVRRILEEEEAKPARARDPVASWRRMAEIIREKKDKPYGHT